MQAQHAATHGAAPHVPLGPPGVSTASAILGLLPGGHLPPGLKPELPNSGAAPAANSAASSASADKGENRNKNNN